MRSVPEWRRRTVRGHLRSLGRRKELDVMFLSPSLMLPSPCSAFSVPPQSSHPCGWCWQTQQPVSALLHKGSLCHATMLSKHFLVLSWGYPTCHVCVLDFNCGDKWGKSNLLPSFSALISCSYYCSCCSYQWEKWLHCMWLWVWHLKVILTAIPEKNKETSFKKEKRQYFCIGLSGACSHAVALFLSF